MNDQARWERKYIERFVKDIEALSQLPETRRHRDLVVDQFPFDSQLLQSSRLYRKSRQLYLATGGRFVPRLCSPERSLSEVDLFSREIEFAPLLTELLWFKDNHIGFMDPKSEIEAINRFNNVSLFHEQNHRILWRLVPPPPRGAQALSRYFNFTESLALTLDVALAEEVGKSSAKFHRMKVLYRIANGDWQTGTKASRRRYLLAVFYATYCRLEVVGRPSQIQKGVDRVFSNQPQINRKAVRRSFEIEDSFMTETIPRWRRFHRATARGKLKKIHAGSTAAPLRLPDDPFEPGPELFSCVSSVFDHYFTTGEARA